MNNYPMKCRISNDSGQTRVEVFDDIGAGMFGGLSASDFAAKLDGVKGALEVHINSGGGIVWDGITIANAIRGHRGRVTTVVDGIAASIASVIAQAGQERVMQPGSMLMIHDAYAPGEGNAEEHAKLSQTLNQVSDNLAAQYANRAGGTAGEWRARMRAETWFTADEAVAAGLADRVAGQGAAIPSGYDLAAYSGAPSRIAAALRSLPVMDATPEPSCADLGHQCCRDAAAERNLLRSIIRDEIRAADMTHPAMTTDGHTHSHADGEGGMHSHEHAHDGDAIHADHVHDEPDGDETMSNHAAGYRRIVNEKYNTDDRKRLASQGHAMPDGSYPIADEEDLHNAIHAVGRGGSDHDAIRRHIIKRARALGHADAIPDNWDSDGSMKTSTENLSVADIRALFGAASSSLGGK